MHAAMLAITPVIRRTDDLPNPPVLTMPQANERPIEDIAAQRAPDPVRAGDFPSRPARMPVFQSTNILGYHSVMEDQFMIRMEEPPGSWIGMPPGRMTPSRDRTNIENRAATPYGSQFVFDPYTAY